MLSLIDLEAYFARLMTPVAGRRLVEKARREAPIRLVQSRMSNVITHYQSRKMGKTLATESRTVEFPALITYEFDSAVLEYHPQPVKLDIIVTDGGARKPYRLQHTPDFLILRDDQILIEEWREEQRLLRLSEKNPGRYERDENGWRMPEVEAQLRDMGIHYRLRTPDEHPHQFIQNISFLADYLAADYPPVGAKELEGMRSCFSERAAMTIGDLIEAGRAAGSLKHGGEE